MEQRKEETRKVKEGKQMRREGKERDEWEEERRE